MKIIKPALLKDKIVICDRFVDSTMAYQGVGLGVNSNFLDLLSNEITEGITPNITFIFDMDIKTSLKRASIRDKKKQNRYENFNEEFHKKVRNYFQSLTKIDKRYVLIDASKNIEQISSKIFKSLSDIII